MKQKENRTREQIAADRQLLQEKKEAFKLFEKETRAKYLAEAQGYKAVLAETEKRAKKQVAEYKQQVTDEYKAKVKELKQQLSGAADAGEKDRIRAELAAAT